MIFSIAAQTIVFFKAILIGLAVGVFYDILRAIRWELHMGNKPTGALDGVFWFGCILLFILFVLISADGNGRYYVFIGMGSGVTLYLLSFSSLVLNLTRWIVRLIRTIVLLALGLLVKIFAPLLCHIRKAIQQKSLSKFLKKHFLFCTKRFKMK